mmetsp:Transcript_93842/g.201491  ORF Transcript_93842/g.201491 Transcript_93842/m.201491 type:complete len:210 (+) Transcript_93842:259-888(+)
MLVEAVKWPLRICVVAAVHGRARLHLEAQAFASAAGTMACPARTAVVRSSPSAGAAAGGTADRAARPARRRRGPARRSAPHPGRLGGCTAAGGPGHILAAAAPGAHAAPAPAVAAVVPDRAARRGHSAGAATAAPRAAAAPAAAAVADALATGRHRGCLAGGRPDAGWALRLSTARTARPRGDHPCQRPLVRHQEGDRPGPPWPHSEPL